MSLVRSAGFLGLLLVAATPIHAASGVVRADIGYWENNGGWCDRGETGRDCTAAVFDDSHFNTRLPMKRVRIEIRRTSDDVVLGQGTTNSSGVSLLSWSTLPWESAPVGYIKVTLENGDGVFSIKNSTGGAFALFTSNFQLTNGTTSGSPQTRTNTFGSSGSPNTYANLYGAVTRSWESLDDSNRLATGFNGYQVWAFNGQGTNATYPSSNYTMISTGRLYMQVTISHEMGHQAEYESHAYAGMSNYCFPFTTCDPQGLFGGHDMFTTEWQATSFLEGFAEFVAARSIYRQASPQPRTCRDAGEPCSLDDFSPETSIGTANCVSNDGRTEAATIRYLWDVYDSVGDSYGDNLTKSFSFAFDGQADWATGNANRQLEEPYDIWGNVDDRDGRNTADFAYSLANDYGAAFLSSTVLTNNCGSVLNP